jgi:hypothetical protein
LQYGLAERAVGLGWAAERVLVIDDDLGGWCLSGSASSLVDPGWARIISM